VAAGLDAGFRNEAERLASFIPLIPSATEPDFQKVALTAAASLKTLYCPRRPSRT